MPKETASILMLGAECAPYVKIGGLADVMGTLPKELNRLKLDARVMMPFHRTLKDRFYDDCEMLCQFVSNVGGYDRVISVFSMELDEVIYYFIDNNDMFAGPVYKGGFFEGEQYAVFCRGVCECLDRIGFIPDIIQCNDWQTGMVPEILKTFYHDRPQGKCKTIYSIHNMMYQGEFERANFWSWFGLKAESFMKSGLINCDWISTVSPTYVDEICTEYYGYGMDDLLRARRSQITGIINGINVTEYNPWTDKKIFTRYSANTIKNKIKCKQDLADTVGLDIDVKKTPVIGFVSRMVEQKGIDLIIPVIDEIMKEDVAFVFLGTGEERYQNFFRSLEKKYKGRVCAYIAYDDKVAHKVYAGSDFFLMPSKFEPCGISQMIAMRYGTVPIVRKTGGLNDTVSPYNQYTGEGTGFSFDNYNAHDMMNVIRYALEIYKDKEVMETLIRRDMEQDFSFVKSARVYKSMYLNLLKNK